MEQNPEKTTKVGVLTLPYDPNYGWILQHYALLKTLKENGYDSYSIYRKWDKQKNRTIVYHFKKWIYYNILTRNIYRFYQTYIHPKTEVFDTQESIKSIDKYNFSAIIVGSDQVWRTKNTVLVGDNFFLDFFDSDQITKIAYAVSFGIDEWQEDAQKTLTIKSLLDDFQYISVRESSGIDICKNNFNIDVNRLIDPSLLLVKEQYNELLKNKSQSFKTPTLVNYILDYDTNKREIIQYIAEEQSLNVFELYPKKKKLWNYYKSVETWLSAFRDADFVVTDSFHGTVFSIIYNKPFITIANKERGLTRFLSILNLLGLTSRLVYSLTDVVTNNLLKEKIDFNQANQIIQEEKNRSVSMFRKYITKRN